jgi:hypothetical protein
MKYLDTCESCIQWASEEFYIPYISPIDKRWHRYYPDFLVEFAERDGSRKTSVIEIKPKRETEPPKQKRRTKRMLAEARTFAINTAKWKAARAFCNERGYAFRILTEKELAIA